eukprot:8720310-Ditylum_brightwellii.AAC.1
MAYNSTEVEFTAIKSMGRFNVDLQGWPAADCSKKHNVTFWGGADKVDSVSWELLESVLGVQPRDVERFHRESCSEGGGSYTPGGPPSNIVVG